jgi:hypothetical protein
MPASYEIDKERRLVISKGTGVITLADGLAHQKQLLADPDFDRSFSQLMDFTEVTKWELRTEDLRQLAAKNVFSSMSRRAFVVGSEEAFGLGRMFETFREMAGEQGIRVFRSRAEAMSWVLSSPEKVGAPRG